MQKSINDLRGIAIVAIDGDVGTLDDLYFDDKFWTIRYLMASTGNWFAGKDVLLSPFAVGKAEVSNGRICAMVTRKQIDASPTIDTGKMVSSQHESSYYDYYGYPYYWNGPYLWGAVRYPQVSDGEQQIVADQGTEREEMGDLHLRSAAAVTGYHIEAADGDIGHVEDFIIDDESWEIRYIVVDAHHWLPGKRVLIAPRWIERVTWEDSKVYINLSREVIQSGPEYHSETLNREYERKLYEHYDRPNYWEQH